MSTLTITGLFIYPVKSMQGIALRQTQLTHKGLVNDRQWMVVKSNGKFVTQRDIPQLTLIHTSLDENGVVLSMDGHRSISVPFDPFKGEPLITKVWGDRCETLDQGEYISSWLTRALDSKDPLRLVRMNPEFTRPPNHTALMGEENTTVFADAAPFLVANEASLEKLNSVLESTSLQPVPMNRFRPNIVVRGLAAFAEHKIAELSTENYKLKLCYPCTRCIVTTINQHTAEKDPHKQPFKTLQRINPMPGEEKAPAFAENAILTYGDGQKIALGDHFETVFK